MGLAIKHTHTRSGNAQYLCNTVSETESSGYDPMYTAKTASVARFVHRSPALQKPSTTGFQTNTPLVNPLLLDYAHLSEAISKFPFWFSTDAFSHLTSQ
jgi:hypothetical protein